MDFFLLTFVLFHSLRVKRETREVPGTLDPRGPRLDTASVR